MMGSNDGAIDHLQGVWDGSAAVQGLKDIFPQARKCPASKLPVNARPFAELFGQVPPGRSCPRDPKNPIQNKAVIGWFAAIRGTDCSDEVFKQRPFIVAHQVSGQAGLHGRYQLESRRSPRVNPFCQHGLGIGDQENGENHGAEGHHLQS